MTKETSVNDELIYTENLSSWERMKMLMQLYWPGIKPGFIGFAVFPLLLIVVCGLIYPFYNGVFQVAVVVPLTFATYASPTLLCNRDYRHVSDQLPVTAAEKLGFLLIVFWIVVPGVLMLSTTAGEYINSWIYSEEVSRALFEIDKAQTEGVNIVLYYLSIVSMITIVLYYIVTTRRHNRMRAGLLGFCVTMLSIMLIMGLAGGVAGFYQGYQEAAGMPHADAAFVNDLSTWLMEGTTVLLLMVAAVYVVKLYKFLRNHGF